MVLFLSFIKKKNVLQRFLIFLLYFCKRMDSLFLFQFACFIFMLVNAFIMPRRKFLDINLKRFIVQMNN